MSKNNVLILPVWKKESSVEEWFYELAMLARKHPERFKRVAMVYEEVSEDKKFCSTDYYAHGCTTTELLGMLEYGKHKVIERVTS